MKRKFIVLVAMITLGSIAGLAQTVIIIPTKQVYRRPKPQHDFKRTFTIKRPIARASTPALSKKITAAVNPEKVLEINIKEEINEYQWLEEAGYKILYNQQGLLCMELWMTGTAAYPDSVTKTVVVDIAKGNRVAITDVFKDLATLAPLVRSKQKAEVEKATKEMKSDPDADPEQLFSETNFKVEDFGQFAVDAKGVSFLYDYGFPHVLEALQPDGRYHFTWNELRPFIRTDGLLARFVR
jgi:hypothetical protein